MAVIELTKENFLTLVCDIETTPVDWKYLGDKPCIVSFSAPWCSYCKRLDPVLEEFSNLFSKEVYIYKVDVDKEEELDLFFKIRTIPTLLFCSLDGEKDLILGTMSKQELKILIQQKLL